MKCQAVPYQGDEAFAFFSYCHADSAVVYPLIEDLARMGYRIWYDDGISIGDDWPEVIAEKLEKCAVFIAALTPAYCASHNCKNEMTFQVEDGKLIFPLMLEDFPLIGGIRLQLVGRQYLKLFQTSTEKWADAIAAFEPMQQCKGPIDILPDPPPDPPPKYPPENPLKLLDIAKAELLAVRLSDGVILRSNGERLMSDRRKADSSDAAEITMTADRKVRVRAPEDRSTLVNGAVLKSGEEQIQDRVFVIAVDGEHFAVAWGENAAWLKEQERLCILTADSTAEVRWIPREGLMLGRNYRWAGDVMTDRRISHFHAKLSVQDGRTILTDYSRNGTFVNDRQVPHSEDGQPLSSGDMILLGMESFHYQEIELADSKKEAYEQAVQAMVTARGRADYQTAASLFAQLDNYLDSRDLRKTCLDKAEELRKKEIYLQALQDADSTEPEQLEKAIAALASLGDWQDAKRLTEEYIQKLNRWKAMEQDYQQACQILESAETEQALAEAEKSFAALGNYRDSGLLQLRCREKREALRRREVDRKNTLYDRAFQEMRKAGFREAASLLRQIPGWKDADSLLSFCLRLMPDGTDTEESTPPEDPELTIRGNPGLSGPKPARLILVDLETGEVFEGKPQSTVIGRKANQCDVAFPSNSLMSRRHTEIFTFRDTHYIRDCHSANGTIVNGAPVDTDQTIKIGSAAILEIGGMHLLVAFDEAARTILRQRFLSMLWGQNSEEPVILTGEPKAFSVMDMECTIIDGEEPRILCAELWQENTNPILEAKADGCIRVGEEILEQGTRICLREGQSVQIGEACYQYVRLPVILL